MKAKNRTLRSKQTWRRSKENNEGWFTLKNERSSLFLNWNSLSNLTLEDEKAEGQVIYIESVSIHPKYNYRQSYRDIAVIKLKENATLTAWVHPICVPEEAHNDPNKWERQSVDVIGYAYSGFTVNNNLKETEVKILNNELCNDKVREKIEAGKKGKLKVAKNTQLLTFAFLCKDM